jgi:hypothetical protein
MRVLSVSWDSERDITKLKFNAEFLSSNWVVRADIIQDLLHDIEKIYAEILKENYDE